MKKVIQFGAGNIGRGFLAQLFTESSYEIVFVDINPELIYSLNKTKSYVICIMDESPKEIRIKNIRAINGKDTALVTKEIVEAELMAASVGPNALKTVAPLIAEGIKERADLGVTEPINLIIAENLLHSDSILKKYILGNSAPEDTEYINKHLGLVSAVIRRRVPLIPEELKRKEPLKLLAENYYTLPVDKKGFIGKIPEIRHMLPVDNIDALMEQKLFLHNSGYTIPAYLGYLKGCNFLHQAMDDKDIYPTVVKALDEIGDALIKKHKFNPQEQRVYINYLLKRYADKILVDSIDGLARDPIRKLGRNDRLTGAARLAWEQGIVPESITLGIAAGLCYDNPRDGQAVKLARDLDTKGIDIVLEEVCGLNPQEKLARLIKEKWVKLRNRLREV